MIYGRLLSLLLGAAMVSGAGNPTSPRLAGSEIVVRGMTTKDARSEARKFARSQAGGPIARWNNWLCFSAQGLSADQSAMFLSLVNRDTSSVGLHTIEDRACTWNVLIGFTADADAFAAS